jgi:hypothetical protein
MSAAGLSRLPFTSVGIPDSNAIVTRSVEIATPPSAVFALVGDLRRFNEWSPWADIDPETVFTFTGPIDGVGQTLNWESKDERVGTGSMSIAAAV